MTDSRDSRMIVSRVIGALFLTGFLVYGAGSAMTLSVVDDGSFLATVPSHQTTLVLGAFLMFLVTVIDVGKAILFFPVLSRHGRRTALTYLSTMIVEVVLMAIGAIALLMLVPLAEQQTDAGPSGEGWTNGLASLAVDANEIAYQSAQMLLAIGCLFVCTLLLRSGLIPKALAVLGLVGYALHMVGATSEIFGLHISLVMLIPGGVFEVALALWLIVKGFERTAYGAVAETELDPVHLVAV